MGKDKKKKHKKKDAVGTSQWTYEFTYTLPLTSFGSVPTGYGMVWSTYVPPVSVPQIFHDAFEDGELKP